MALPLISEQLSEDQDSDLFEALAEFETHRDERRRKWASSASHFSSAYSAFHEASDGESVLGGTSLKAASKASTSRPRPPSKSLRQAWRRFTIKWKARRLFYTLTEDFRDHRRPLDTLTHTQRVYICECLQDIAAEGPEGRYRVLKLFTAIPSDRFAGLKALFCIAEAECREYFRVLKHDSAVRELLRRLAQEGSIFRGALPRALKERVGSGAALQVLIETRGDDLSAFTNLPLLLKYLIDAAVDFRAVEGCMSALRALDCILQTQTRREYILQILTSHERRRYQRDIVDLLAQGPPVPAYRSPDAREHQLKLIRLVMLCESTKEMRMWLAKSKEVAKSLTSVAVEERNHISTRYSALAALRVVLSSRQAIENARKDSRILSFCLHICMQGDKGWKAIQNRLVIGGSWRLPKLYPEDDAHQLLSRLTEHPKLSAEIASLYNSYQSSPKRRAAATASLCSMTAEMKEKSASLETPSQTLSVLARRFVEAQLLQFLQGVAEVPIPALVEDQDFRLTSRCTCDALRCIGRLREQSESEAWLKELLRSNGGLWTMVRSRLEDEGVPLAVRRAAAYALGVQSPD